MKDNQLSKLKKRHWLKESIKERGLTYQQVADQIGVSSMTVYNYVKGHTIPTPKLRMLSDLLGCTMQAIDLGCGLREINRTESEQLRARWNALYDLQEPGLAYYHILVLESMLKHRS